LFVILMLGQLAAAQLVVPTFGVRGDVSDAFLADIMSAVRVELAHATGLEVVSGDRVIQGIAGSLEPDFTIVIAQLGAGRFGVSGEVAAEDGGRYTLTLMVGDREGRRFSDLMSETFTRKTLGTALASLAREVNAFVHPRDALPPGDAEVFITSQPAEAEVFINGVSVGVTSSLEPLALEPGRYQFEFRKEGYLPHREAITLESGHFKFVSVQLTAAAGGSIQVTSRPSADVYLDGEFKGRTPLVVVAPPGVRDVRLERAGFMPQQHSVPVRNFRVNRLSAELRPASEPLIFWEPVPGRLVFVNGLLRVESYVEGLRGGLHTIEVWHGDERERFRVVITSSGAYELDLETRELIPFP
jgi:hypothetical protein